MIIDHISLPARDIERSKQFYTTALAPLGIQFIMEFGGWIGFGVDRKPEFWLVPQTAPQPPMHVAFAAASREQVRLFHEAALAAGGKDNGGPGLRPNYHPRYYGAFVIDPDGHNVEAVCHKRE